jgi:rhodanese-related sulfurtransferase
MFGFLKKMFQEDNSELTDALKRGGTILDVRSFGEFQMGSAQGAKNVPVGNIRRMKKKISKMKQPIILCCASGARASMAQQELKNMGYDDVVNGRTWRRVSQAQREG